jgi:hypothetical protein
MVRSKTKQFLIVLLLAIVRPTNGTCKNRFAGCVDRPFNKSVFNGTLSVAKVTKAPSPYVVPYDDSLDKLMAGIVNEPWRCNVSGWGGIVWTRCRAPDTPICIIEPLNAPAPSSGASQSQSNRRRRNILSSLAPSPSQQSSCRAKVALSQIVDGWCNEEAVCDVQCSTDPNTRRVLDFYCASSDMDCPRGFQVDPSNVALAWFVAACAMLPATCLSSWRMWVLILRSRLHWRSYWVGCGGFSNLIFRWPIGRFIFATFAGGSSIILMSFRKFDKIGDEHSEEVSLLGIDLFVGSTFAAATYLWFVTVTSVPLALGHRAMALELPPPKKVGLGSNSLSKEEDETNIIDLRGQKEKEQDKREKEKEISKKIDGDAILRRLGMRSQHTEKSMCMQAIRRNWLKSELRKQEALQDVRR